MDITACRLTYFLAVGILLSGCGSESNQESQIEIIATPNIPPIVSISPIHASLRQGRNHTLTAQANDPDGSINKIQWQQIAGPTLELSEQDGLQLSFMLPEIENRESTRYHFQLTVTDDDNAKSKTEISFTSHYGMDQLEAAHLLHQATMGPTKNEIQDAIGLDEYEWLKQEIGQQTTLHTPLVINNSDTNVLHHISRISAWWQATLSARDQLRQRVAFALSQIFVISDSNFGNLLEQPVGLSNYYDQLGQYAFGNFRDLLETVTLSPIMGTYLSHLGNKKPDVANNTRPDENYAREVMQLFTIGLVELNQDGTPKLDNNGNHISTYSQEQITGFAHVFTGWTYAGATYWKWPRNFIDPMEPWDEFHDKNKKILLNGTVLPAGQSAQQDLDQALDNLFYHPNVPPFISKQLIQRLVTSNPSPQYVKRVADVFTDNGEGIRGDMAAIIKAILLDDEARQPYGVLQYSGKIREPLLRTVQFWRELNAASTSDWFYVWSQNSHGQVPLGSPSVFNFFRPDYQPPELQVWQSPSPFNSSLNIPLVAPELQIANDATLIGQFNHQFAYQLWHIKELANNPHENTILLTLQPHVDRLNIQGIDALLDHYNVLFFSGRMSEAMRQTLVNTYNIFANWSDYQKVGYLLFTISVSPEYVLQH